MIATIHMQHLSGYLTCLRQVKNSVDNVFYLREFPHWLPCLKRVLGTTLRTNLLSLPTTRTRHVGNDPNLERYDPDLWTDEFAFLNQPGQADIQSDLFYDYRTNVDAYPKWQAWMREKQPRLLVLWGKYDLSFEL